jgi:Immunoglobulin I-set domain.
MGEIIKLKVSMAGMPPPTARWLHNGEPLTSGGRYEITHTDRYLNLRISDARRADRGEYQAHGVNSLGEDVASFLVTVTGNLSRIYYMTLFIFIMIQPNRFRFGRPQATFVFSMVILRVKFCYFYLPF